jgi:anti-sigma B factor antagonist
MSFEPPQFRINEQDLEGPNLVVQVDGEIHASTAPEFAERLHAAVEGGKTGIVLDLTGVEFIDSTGLSVLLSGLRKVTRVGGQMVIACANPTVLRLFEITKLDSTFEILASRDEAVERLLRQPAAD